MVFMSFRLKGRDKQWSVNQDKFVYPSLRTANTWSVECHDKTCTLAPISLLDPDQAKIKSSIFFFFKPQTFTVFIPLPIFPQNKFTLHDGLKCSWESHITELHKWSARKWMAVRCFFCLVDAFKQLRFLQSASWGW